jgi:hypothetical protein
MNDATAPTVSVSPVPAGIKLSYGTVQGAYNYTICRESPPGSTCVLLSLGGESVLGSTISRWDNGLAPGSSHAYRVTAWRPDGHFGESSPATGVAGSLPSPGNLRVVPVSAPPASAVLAWDPVQYSDYTGPLNLTTYLFSGSGISAPQVANGTQITLPLSSGPGVYHWQVASMLANPAGGWQTSAPPAVFDYAYVARYRLVALGVKALKQSADDIFGVDGIADEVYVAAVINTTTRALSGTSFSIARSTTYGDVGRANAFPGRVQAGTASPTGGIRTGDQVPITLNLAGPTGVPSTLGFPFLLWEDALDDNGMVIVAPSLWEEDSDKTLYGSWVAAIKDDAQKGYPWGLAAVVTGLRDQDALGPASGPKELLWCDCVNGVDRPIGLQRDYPTTISMDYLTHKVLVLTRSAIERALTGPSQVAGSVPGTIVVPLYERTPIMTAMYELYLRVERVP